MDFPTYTRTVREKDKHGNMISFSDVMVEIKPHYAVNIEAARALGLVRKSARTLGAVKAA